jgi:hypothetical protein
MFSLGTTFDTFGIFFLKLPFSNELCSVAN